MYLRLLSLLKLMLAVFVMTVAWCFVWWMFLVYIDTHSTFVAYLLVIDLLFILFFVRWNRKQTPPHTNGVALLLAIVAVIGIGFYSRFSSQWLFEDFTAMIQPFTGTISYMFNYTRQHTDVIKLLGYCGVFLYMYLIGNTMYVWYARNKSVILPQNNQK